MFFSFQDASQAMKEILEMPSRKSLGSLETEISVSMPTVLLPTVPKFKWGDFDDEDVAETPQKIEIVKNCESNAESLSIPNVDIRMHEVSECDSAEKDGNCEILIDGGVSSHVNENGTENQSGANESSVVKADDIKTTSTPNDDQDPSLDISMAGNVLMRKFNEASVGESKERFRQRLWCYLFENLNRAIDELYFMCELECDMEQIQEALLVFNEAGVDFSELKARVEGFDNLKQPTGTNVGPVNSGATKLEHQRPHAIAWEVRRMASSPRRADILSSSLEALKKVQHGSGKQDNVQQTKRRDAVRFLSFEQDATENLAMARSQKMNETKDTAVKVKTRNAPPTGHDESSTGLSSDTKQDGTVEGDGGKSSVTDIVQTSCPLEGASPDKCKDHPQQFAETVATDCDISEDANRKAEAACVEETEKGPHTKVKEKKSNTKTALEAWKEKRNWEDILSSPSRNPSRTSRSPGVGRKSTERGRVLHDKLMSPERKKKSPMEMKKEVDEKQARATRIRRELEQERVLRLQRTTEKLNRVSEWQAVRSTKLREGMHARQQRGESRHEAHLAQIARRASDESSKVSEVRFITSLNEENKKLSLQQKLQDSELRRAERLQNLRIKQKEDVAREEAALERRKLLEAERLQRITDTQRKKEESQARREEERKAASAAREARAVEQVRKKEVRAKAQEEEVELLRQKLSERLRESALRRKVYLEQIRERAVTDSREQGSPLSRRPSSREGQSRNTGVQNNETEVASERDLNAGNPLKVSAGAGNPPIVDSTHQALKKRIKKIRQRLTTRRFEFVEPSLGTEGSVSVTAATRSKIGRWVQDLQRLQQTRKAGASATGLIIAEVIKYLEGKEVELHVARHTGFLDFIATALPASYTSKPDSSQTTIALLKVLLLLLSLPANRSYFLARNLLPPLIPILSTALENYSSVGCSSVMVGSNTSSTKDDKLLADEKFDAVAEVLEDLLKCVTLTMGHSSSDERQLQIQDDMVELIVVYDIIHRLRNLFALFDRPQIEGAPFPPPVLLGLKLLETLTRGKMFTTTQTPFGMATQFFHFQNSNAGMVPATSMCAGAKKSVEVPDRDKQVYCSENPECSEDSQSVEHHGSSTDSSTADSSAKASVAGVGLEVDDKSEYQSAADRNYESVSPVRISKSPGSHESGSLHLRSSRDDVKKHLYISKSVGFLLVAIAETGLVGLPSILTAVLLQANPRASPEQAASALPSNFEEVATSVLRVLNNTACLDLSLVQTMLAMPDLKMEFFHLVSFLLSYCTCKWKAATDQVASLLLETLLLLGYFALLHSGNQAVLRWGKSPTILHKICDLPFAFFSDPELTPILVGTLLAACYGSERNRDVIQQELSMEMLLSVLRSSKGEADNNKHGKPVREGIENGEMHSALLSKQQVRRMDAITEESEEELQQMDSEDRRVQSEEELDVPLNSARSSRSNFTAKKQLRSVKDNEGEAGLRSSVLRKHESVPAQAKKVKPSKNQGVDAKDKQLLLVFLLENRFPSSLWESAVEFFSLR